MVNYSDCDFRECQYGHTATERAKKAAKEEKCPQCGKKLTGFEIIGCMINLGDDFDPVESVKEARERRYDYDYQD